MANDKRKYYLKEGDGYKEFEVDKKVDNTITLLQIIGMLIVFPFKLFIGFFAGLFGFYSRK